MLKENGITAGGAAVKDVNVSPAIGPGKRTVRCTHISKEEWSEGVPKSKEVQRTRRDARVGANVARACKRSPETITANTGNGNGSLSSKFL